VRADAMSTARMVNRAAGRLETKAQSVLEHLGNVFRAVPGRLTVEHLKVRPRRLNGHATVDRVYIYGANKLSTLQNGLGRPQKYVINVINVWERWMVYPQPSTQRWRSAFLLSVSNRGATIDLPEKLSFAASEAERLEGPKQRLSFAGPQPPPAHVDNSRPSAPSASEDRNAPLKERPSGPQPAVAGRETADLEDDIDGVPIDDDDDIDGVPIGNR